MAYISFENFIHLRKSQIKLSLIDVFESNLNNQYHSNLYDPKIAIILERNCFVDLNFFVKTNDGYIIDDIGYREKIPQESVFNDIVKVYEEDYFLLGGDSNYYHWNLNWLPRLFLYEKLNLDCKIIVNQNFNQMQKKILQKIFPWIVEKLVKIEGVSQFKNLYIPNFYLNPIHSPFVIRNIRSRLFSLYMKEISQPKFAPHVFISRSKAKYRKIINENELLARLEDYNFKKIILEDLDFIDQINLFYHAEKIISPHGAGLTNLLFCNKKPKVIEVTNEHYTSVFWSLGYVCGSSTYDIYKADFITQSHNVPIHRDINIDIDDFFIKYNKFLKA